MKETSLTSKKQRKSATKRNDILIHATTRMNLENIMLSEIIQTQKDKYSDSSYVKYLK